MIRSLFVDRSTSASEQYCLLDTRITAADGLRVTSQILYNNTVDDVGEEHVDKCTVCDWTTQRVHGLV